MQRWSTNWTRSTRWNWFRWWTTRTSNLFWNNVVEQDQDTPETTPEVTPEVTTTPEETKTPNWNPKNQTVWLRSSVPTYTAPDGKTYTGMSQEQFNQRLQDYEMENAALKQRQQVYQQRRNETVGNGSMTKDQLFKDALSKMYENPSAFTDEQKDLLYRTGEQLGYFNDTMQASPKQTETATWTTTTTVAMNEPATTADRISYTPETQIQTQPQQTWTTKQGWAYALWFSL